MLDKVNSILESIKNIKNWGGLLQVFVTTTVIFFLSAPREFLEGIKQTKIALFSGNEINLKIEDTELQLLINNFNRKHNVTTGVGIYDSDNDVKIKYLDSYRGYVWNYANLKINQTVSIKNRHFSLDEKNMKCAYISPEEDLYYQQKYHITFCEILGRKAIVFSFQEKDEPINSVNFMENLSFLSNKIERKIIGMD